MLLIAILVGLLRNTMACLLAVTKNENILASGFEVNG